MKKLAAVLMAAAMLCMAGCGNDEKVIDGNSQGADAAQTGGEQSGQTGNASGSQGNYEGYVFSTGGTVIEIDADAAPILDALGKELSYYEAASCAFEGLDKMYTYSGFEIDTYPTGDKDYVSTIILKDDSVATMEGVSIGDSKEKLVEAYGEGSQEGNMIVYEKGGMKLCFILENDEIKSIEYRSKVLDA